MNMGNIQNRKQLIDQIAYRALCGNLGFFTGTGFSIAMNDNACSFEKLVKRIYNCDESDLNVFPKKFTGLSFPQMVEEIEKEKGREKVLGVVEDCCSLNVDELFLNEVKEYISAIKPQWIITTNYDLIMEQLVDNSRTIGPYNPFFVQEGMTTIFHMHGHIRDSQNIVVSEKDYVDLLKVDDYRQMKLSSSLAESSVIFMGYRLGDINVRAALNRAQTYNLKACDEFEKRYPKIYVQAEYDSQSFDDADDEVLYDENVNLYTLKIKNIKFFLKEISEKVKEFDAMYKKFIAEIEAINNKGYLKSERTYRKKVIESLKGAPPKYLNEVSDVFRDVLSDIWKSSSNDGAFEEYNSFVQVALDLLQDEIILSLKPSLLYEIMRRLNSLGSMYDPERKYYGGAWDASLYWKNNKGLIEMKVKEEMGYIAKTNGYYNYLHKLV
ncbi:MAG: SIR2 family protein [Treponema sp.]|nr:SIR2 family protein [Treponema sp.]